jgi:tetraacyldisaccharide 4'-kinase
MNAATLRPQPWLAPLGLLFEGATALRAALYRRRVFPQVRLSGPVISVGNLSVGGSGKTPVVGLLARLLMEKGHPVAILSRGYGGSFRGECLVVSDGKSVLAGADTAGDEPVMLARALPGAVVAVGARRDVVGRAVESRFGRRVHLLDDGFQHLRLARNLDVVCVSASDLEDRLLPAGRLRESPAALQRAGLVLLATDGATPAALARAREQLGPERTFLTSREVIGFADTGGAAAPAPRQAFLVSGIARPERLVNDVQAQGVAVVGHAIFADHHRFRGAEVAAAGQRARAAQADALVITEKDAVRFPASAELPVRVLRIRAAIDDAPRFEARILAAVEAVR